MKRPQKVTASIIQRGEKMFAERLQIYKYEGRLNNAMCHVMKGVSKMLCIML